MSKFPRSVDYLPGKVERIEASRNLMDQVRKLEMLRGFGFDCRLERHAGFWLLHWSFPRLKLVSGHVVRKDAK